MIDSENVHELRKALMESEARLQCAYDALDEVFGLRRELVEANTANTKLQGELDDRFKELSLLEAHLENALSSQRVVEQAAVPQDDPGLVARLTRSFRARLSGMSRRRLRNRILRSGLFDRQWYLRNYPDVAKAGADPLEHYLDFGAAEGRLFNPYFDVSQYVREHPEARGNPLLHALRRAGRD
jgi:hypothetical protein